MLSLEYFSEVSYFFIPSILIFIIVNLALTSLNMFSKNYALRRLFALTLSIFPLFMIDTRQGKQFFTSFYGLLGQVGNIFLILITLSIFYFGLGLNKKSKNGITKTQKNFSTPLFYFFFILIGYTFLRSLFFTDWPVIFTETFTQTVLVISITYCVIKFIFNKDTFSSLK